MHIGKSELISFKIAVNEAADLHGFPRSTAAVYVLNNLRDYNKKVYSRATLVKSKPRYNGSDESKNSGNGEVALMVCYLLEGYNLLEDS